MTTTRLQYPVSISIPIVLRSSVSKKHSQLLCRVKTIVYHSRSLFHGNSTSLKESVSTKLHMPEAPVVVCSGTGILTYFLTCQAVSFQAES